MINYKTLNKEEKLLFNNIEELFIKSELSIYSFYRVIITLLNKYRSLNFKGF